MLLDADRIETDRAAGRDARIVARERGLEVVLMTPNLEGLLVRLYEGRETHVVAPRGAERQLKALWPGYHKGSLRADHLRRRFTLTDLGRAARFDEELRKLLGILGLIEM